MTSTKWIQYACNNKQRTNKISFAAVWCKPIDSKTEQLLWLLVIFRNWVVGLLNLTLTVAVVYENKHIVEIIDWMWCWCANCCYRMCGNINFRLQLILVFNNFIILYKPYWSKLRLNSFKWERTTRVVIKSINRRNDETTCYIRAITQPQKTSNKM